MLDVKFIKSSMGKIHFFTLLLDAISGSLESILWIEWGLVAPERLLSRNTQWFPGTKAFSIVSPLTPLAN